MILLVLLIVLVLGSGFMVGALLGAPFLPTRGDDTEAILDLAQLQPGQLLLDLGSGDGRLLKAAAKRNVKAVGYEINLLLVIWSKLACWRYRRLVKIRWQNYWRVKLPEADAIYLFLIDHYTAKLDRKLAQELTRPTKVVSYVFEMPRKAERSNRNTHLYIYP